MTIMGISSCSTIKVLTRNINQKVDLKTNHWVTYLENNNQTTIEASIEQKPISNNRISAIDQSAIPPEKDSIKIITKSGKKHIGTISKKVEDGYFMKINNSKIIFISNNENKSIKYLNNIKPNNTAKDPLLNEKNQISNTSNINDFYNDSDKDISNSENNEIKKVTEPMSLLSFIFGLLGYLPIPFIFGVGLIAAIILSKTGKRKIDRNPEKYKGRGFAIAGKILGIVGLVAIIIIAGALANMSWGQ